MKAPTIFIPGGWLRRAAAAVLLFSLPASQSWAQDNTATGTGALQSDTTGMGNTADGYDALADTTLGSYNTAVGMNSMLGNKDGSHNTAVGSSSLHNNQGSDNSALGYNALYFNVDGVQNTAVGSSVLTQNTQGSDNTAAGFAALTVNTAGSYNTALGADALAANKYGTYNTANGYESLEQNITGGSNTACGAYALLSNTTGDFNTAIGLDALFYGREGTKNTAIGALALANQYFTGSGDTAIGIDAGENATSATNSIYINSAGAASDGSVIDIGTQGTQTVTTIAGIYGEASASGVAVYINSNGQLGTSVSSARFKDDIHDMGDASSELFSLRPVAFRYKPEIDPKGIAQFGLVAEEVDKIDPVLVVHDPDGKPYSVRYEQVNAMLLNEFLKQHKQVQEQRAAIATLAAADARQQGEIDVSDAQFQSELKATEARHRNQIVALQAALKEQAAMIQKVSTDVALGQPAPRTVANIR